MAHADEPNAPAIDTTVRPRWQRTGYTYFPFAAEQSGHWWVLRLNHGFPEHDLYTLFVDGAAVADITGSPDGPSPLAVSVGDLKPYDTPPAGPALDVDTARAVVAPVARFVNYGSEVGDPCIFCSEDYDGMEQA